MSKLSKILLILIFAITLSYSYCYGIDLNLTQNSNVAASNEDTNTSNSNQTLKNNSTNANNTNTEANNNTATNKVKSIELFKKLEKLFFFLALAILLFPSYIQFIPIMHSINVIILNTITTLFSFQPDNSK